jgi:hypothetical protein
VATDSADPPALRIAFLPSVAIALATGFATIVMARAWPLNPVPFGAFTATPAARRWFGLAAGSPGAVGLGFMLVFQPAPAAGYGLVSVGLALTIWFGCLQLARTSSNRPVKQAILAGAAQSYYVSTDGNWWWDGSAWVSSTFGPPEGAVRSPDGNYWWTGHSWIAMPPRRR